jgi:hypothetical protein
MINSRESATIAGEGVPFLPVDHGTVVVGRGIYPKIGRRVAATCSNSGLDGCCGGSA